MFFDETQRWGRSEGGGVRRNWEVWREGTVIRINYVRGKSYFHKMLKDLREMKRQQ